MQHSLPAGSWEVINTQFNVKSCDSSDCLLLLLFINFVCKVLNQWYFGLAHILLLLLKFSVHEAMNWWIQKLPFREKKTQHFFKRQKQIIRKSVLQRTNELKQGTCICTTIFQRMQTSTAMQIPRICYRWRQTVPNTTTVQLCCSSKMLYRNVSTLTSSPLCLWPARISQQCSVIQDQNHRHHVSTGQSL